MDDPKRSCEELAMITGSSKAIAAAAAGVLMAVVAPRSSVAAAPQASFASVLADPIRPPADVARDVDRKPAELLAFAGVRKGMKIAELAPGGGYFTRILTGAVTASGQVYAIAGRASPALEDLSKERRNLTVLVASPGTIPVPDKVDLVWTTLNYHDFKNVKLPTGGDAAQSYDAEAFKALKPGGIYLIVDHEAPPGAGASETSTLHRIEDSVVRREVEAAGFKLESESKMLRNPGDPHTAKVQDASIRGHTDQFVLKFRKPR
jgi:predicted methyltransferase